MKKIFLASLFILATASQAEAGCLRLKFPYSGTLQPAETGTAYGPVTLVNGPGCHSIIIEARVQSAHGGSAPKMWIEKLVNGQWTRQAEALGEYVSQITTAGTFRVRHRNDLQAPRVYSGSTTITR